MLVVGVTCVVVGLTIGLVAGVICMTRPVTPAPKVEIVVGPVEEQA
jgi:hypothetical protein